jgi:GTP-binding protein LepA
VVNKIDLPNADPERTLGQLEDIFGFKRKEVSLVSAKSGIGTQDILKRVIEEVPHPRGDINAPLKAILFDSTFDNYRGAILFLRVFEGKVSVSDEILLMQQKKRYSVDEVGIFLPRMERKDFISCGEVGYLCCGLRDPREVEMGDTITSPKNPTSNPFKGYKKIPPMVFCGIFPADPQNYPLLREAIEKLRLSDPSFIYEPDNLGTLGYGFRCGFLGLLHIEIIQERLEREYNLDLILTSPSVMYKVKKNTGQSLEVQSPHQLPDPSLIEEVYEPFVKANIIAPLDGLEAICELAKARRGTFMKMDYLGKDRLNIAFELPLSEIIIDFYDKIKSLTKGYASLDYEFLDYRKTEIVKIDILFNRKQIEAFSLLVHKQKAESKARTVVEKLKELIPRQMFEISIQAAIGAKIIASERVSALRKNVTAKCYGGDITRKRKLWEKQKEGKKKLKQMGNINVPQEAFLEVLKM